ncbi:PepSY domain-containing protein [Arenimonas composti]|uniref:PepSY domain-containing protein n=1 Tax=Arenimonas composti TR7-09 = DSM 18010 TaxID=1121013 RepID=A0A091BK35_9GAMM|nr:PepSY domain-containing protein [Arenimonas composti]KFN51164.1 hypothetical protein P873_03790 [Arenimonas composti TR7-09 = DSM 18010]
MNLRHTPLALVLVLAAGSVAAQSVNGPADVESKLRAAGYTEVRDVEFDDGLWEAEVRAADGRWHDVAIVAADGELLDARGGRPLLTAAEITARLQAAGYATITDLELDDAIWEADAVAADGRRVEIRLNGHTGAVIDVEDDR